MDFALKPAVISDAVDALDISAAGGDCVSALRRAYTMIEEQRVDENPAGREVYVMSDLAAHAWGAIEGVKVPDEHRHDRPRLRRRQG